MQNLSPLCKSWTPFFSCLVNLVSLYEEPSAEIHSRGSVSSVNRSAKSATVSTAASECFMAVLVWLESKRLLLVLWQQGTPWPLKLVFKYKNSIIKNWHAPFFCCLQHRLHSLFNCRFDEESVNKCWPGGERKQKWAFVYGVLFSREWIIWYKYYFDKRINKFSTLSFLCQTLTAPKMKKKCFVCILVRFNLHAFVHSDADL